jgi:hypothetical protein
MSGVLSNIFLAALTQRGEGAKDFFLQGDHGVHGGFFKK